MNRTPFTWTPTTGVTCWEGDALPERVRVRVNQELVDPNDGESGVLDEPYPQWELSFSRLGYGTYGESARGTIYYEEKDHLLIIVCDALTLRYWGVMSGAPAYTLNDVVCAGIHYNCLSLNCHPGNEVDAEAVDERICERGDTLHLGWSRLEEWSESRSVDGPWFANAMADGAKEVA